MEAVNIQTIDSRETKQKVSLSQLSAMTGFPTDFLKSELLLSGDQPSMKELREKMIQFISSNFE